MAEVIIIGAGLTGLSAAYHLEQNNFFDYKIFEKNDRPGGLLQSIEVDGFTFDHTGHLLHINDAYFKSFLDTIADLTNFNLIERKAAIYSHHTLTDYPFQMNLFGLPTDVIIECIEGYGNRKTTPKEPKTFVDWVLKYFGAGMGKHFFFPYNGKILAYDLTKVHPSWTGRFVPQTSMNAILKGAFEKKPESGVGYNSSFYYPKSGGIEFIIKKIASSLRNPIISKHATTAIDLNTKTVYFENGHQEQFKTLITTMPLDVLLKQTIEPSHLSVTQASKKLLCNAVLNFNLGFAQDALSDKHWIYYPEQQFPFYRMGFWHNLSPSSVKPGHSAIYGETSYLPKTTKELQVHDLLKQSINSALTHLKLNHEDIVIQHINHLKHAYVIYDQWREKNIDKLLATLQEHAILSIGRFGEWKYSSMQDAIFDGKKAADEILKNHQKAVAQTDIAMKKSSSGLKQNTL